MFRGRAAAITTLAFVLAACTGAPVDRGPTTRQDTDYFGRREQQWMLNFGVTDLGAMLDQLRRAGSMVDDKIEEMEGVGRFDWASDPEGNRFELWQPDPQPEPGS